VVSAGPIVTSQTYEFTTLTCSLEGFSISDDSELLLLQIRGNFPDEQRVALATLDKSAGARESSSLKTYFPVSGVSGTMRVPTPLFISAWWTLMRISLVRCMWDSLPRRSSCPRHDEALHYAECLARDSPSIRGRF
ncbi:hypothetical protein BaRGS_00033512, partial [Batillaria attramentaria]